MRYVKKISILRYHLRRAGVLVCKPSLINTVFLGLFNNLVAELNIGFRNTRKTVHKLLRR